MLRIFMTGDNHIGLKYAGHEKATFLAEERINVFEGMVKRANEEACGLFVITGDLFENTYGIPKNTIKRLLDMLSQFEGIVAVLPGNHDYYDKDVKVWQYFKDIASQKDNIVLLNEYRPYELSVSDESVVLYPAHCTSLHSEAGKNNISWIKECTTEKEAYNIGIAHGAIEGETIDREGVYFQMTKSELENTGMDAWLVGHTHVPFPKDISEEMKITGEVVFNAGTHVQTDVSCNTDGCCFVLEMENHQIKAKKVNISQLRFYRKYITVSADNMEKEIISELAGISDYSVVDLVLSGAVSGEEYGSKEEIIEKALTRFIEGTYNDYGITKLINEDLISKEFAQTSFSAALLSELIKDPKEAQLAYELLKSLKEGK